MALIIKDRVQESSSTTGTGNFSLAGAYTGYIAFDDVMANGDTCFYCIEAIDANGNPSGEWETGLGTFNDTDTLVRTTVHASSNAGAAVNFSAGTKRVRLDATATFLNGTGTFVPQLLFGGGSTGMTFSSRDGSYIRIANIVVFTFSFTLSAKGSSTGNATITGLPYNASAGFEYFIRANSMTTVAVPVCTLGSGTATLTLNDFTSSVQAAMTEGDFGNTSSMVISGSYTV